MTMYRTWLCVSGNGGAATHTLAGHGVRWEGLTEREARLLEQAYNAGLLEAHGSTRMRLCSGRQVDLVTLGPDDLILEEISRSLDYICRFYGHVREPWNVLNHSLLVADCVADQYPGRPDLELEALLHDAHEAFMGDISTPVKGCIGAGLEQVENHLRLQFSLRFGVPEKTSPEVERWDKIVTAAEIATLFPGSAAVKIELPQTFRSIGEWWVMAQFEFTRRVRDLLKNLDDKRAAEKTASRP